MKRILKMKRSLQIAAIGVMSYALAGMGVPAQAADHDFSDHRNVQAQHENASWRGDRDRSHHDDRSYRDSYAAPRYSGYYEAPAYGYYEAPGYYDAHAGRSAAIVAGSAAAGAVIGAAAGHGEGAAIGAIVGGVAGVIADQAVRHHDYR